MSTKLFKIGEYSRYGKWRITINEKKENIEVKGIDYFSGIVEEVQNISFNRNVKHDNLNFLRGYLEEVSTVYYADKMMEYVKGKI